MQQWDLLSARSVKEVPILEPMGPRVVPLVTRELMLLRVGLAANVALLAAMRTKRENLPVLYVHLLPVGEKWGQPPLQIASVMRVIMEICNRMEIAAKSALQRVHSVQRDP